MFLRHLDFVIQHGMGYHLYCTCLLDFRAPNVLHFIEELVIGDSRILIELGPGRPPAGGPRMDCRAVTSSGLVKISRLASRLRRSARRLLTPCQDSVIKNRY